ncbi:MAG: sulfite exporter TauE/SafE family protein, partial [Proteobacteria bacterium]|nr:sulfite exporter TauE/SafE family protein [Pseudomonadota bacterium]
MFFTTAGIEVAFWIPPLVAFVVSFFTSMGGISGAFLLLPFQMSFLGYTNPSVSATNQVFNIVAIPSGVYRYWREGRMVWPLTWIVILGTLPGVFIGAIVRVSYLPNPRHFKLFVAAVLLYIGFKMVRDLLNKNSRNGAKASSEKRFQEMVKSGGSKSVGYEISGG